MQQNPGNRRQAQQNTVKSKSRAKSLVGPGLNEPDESAKEVRSEKKPYKRAKISEHEENRIKSHSADSNPVSGADS